MPRLASLYLPNLSTDRVRAAESGGRHSEGKGNAPPLTLPLDGGREPCSCPRGGHGRPGARWARESSPGRGGGPPAQPVVEGAPNLAQTPLHHASHGPPPRPGEELPLLLSRRVGNRLAIAAASPEA